MFGSSPLATSLFGSGDVTVGSLSPFYELFTGAQDIITLVEVVAKAKTSPYGETTSYWQHSVANVEWRDTGDQYLMRLQNPMNFERQATGDDPFGSAPDAISFGALNVRIEPYDTYDFKDYNWNGAELTMKVGLPDFDYADFSTIFVGTIRSASWTKDLLTLTIRDPDELLLEEIQKNKFDGAGDGAGGPGPGGDVNLKGTAKPLLYGYGKNVNPVRIDSVWNVYQFHDGKIEEVEVLYEGGFPMGEPEFDVGLDASTSDVWDWGDGDGRTPTGGQWITSILVDRFDEISASDVIGAATLDLQIPYDVGLYIPSGGVTASQAIQQILSPLQAFLGYTERGFYNLRALRLGTSAGTINEHEIQKMKRLESTPPPVEILKMSWGHNWTVRKDDQLALERSDEFAAFSIQEDRFAIAEESGVSSVLKEREIMTLLTDEADAISEATRQIALMASSDIYEVTITQRVLSFVPGDTVKIIYDAFGFDNGQLMLVLSARENGRAGTTVFRVWGGFI
jgi:hypothetical protein